MKNVLKKWLPFLLAFAMLLTLAGCKTDTPPEGPTDSTGRNEVSGDPDSDEERYKPADKYYDCDFVMLTNVASYSYAGYVWTNEEKPKEICDVAIWQRQNYLEEKYGITLKRLDYEGDVAYQQFNNSMTGGGKICDVTCFSGRVSMNAAIAGYLIDVNKINSLNLEAPYWDQRIQSEYNLAGHIFMLEGDFNFIDDLRTYVVTYNDTLYGDYGYEDKYGTPYEMVANPDSEYKWTYATMLEMIRENGFIDNGDDVADERDTWGMVSESILPYYFFMGSGMKMIRNDEGNLSLAFQDNWSHTYNVIQEYLRIDSDENVLQVERTGALSDASNVWGTATNVFKYDRALFRANALNSVISLIDMEHDYGIMPIPKYTADQEGYYCWVTAANHYPMSFPVTSWSEIEEIGEMAEVLSYCSLYGADSLNHAFYDLLAYARLCRDPDDVAMLKLVFANKTYDVDAALAITDLYVKISEASNAKQYDSLYTNLSAIKDSAAAVLQSKLNDLVANLAKQNLK